MNSFARIAAVLVLCATSGLAAAGDYGYGRTTTTVSGYGYATSYGHSYRYGNGYGYSDGYRHSNGYSYSQQVSTRTSYPAYYETGYRPPSGYGYGHNQGYRGGYGGRGGDWRYEHRDGRYCHGR